MFYFRQISLICLLYSTFTLTIMRPVPTKAQNFFEFLLKHKKREEPPQQPHIIKEQAYAPPPKTVIQKQKDASAKRILIIGDFVASTVANELDKFFADNAGITIINRAVPASGLVRIDYYSWKNNIPELIHENKPDTIIIVVGANDNQPIVTPDGILKTAQPEWIDFYKKRIADITESLRYFGKPWIWMDQPAFENKSLTQKIQTLNELYKKATKEAGGYFVDVWGGFVDEQGQFSFSGYDINGKISILRASDGVNFTSKGRQKLVSYLEKPLENVLSLQMPSRENGLPINVNTLNLTKGDIHNIGRQSPISLYDMARQNTHLLDKIDQNLIKEAQQHLNGHQVNRADNFSLP
ncbi:SGNH family hydrolase [Bartonella australis]|uniref:SGNH/GDSL hydrolase family protein n=1 Tax=Bartonella australis TaxID=388640 RepID=UPI00059EFE41|nr:SGNH family hydrolase [Bartonella australis]